MNFARLVKMRMPQEALTRRKEVQILVIMSQVTIHSRRKVMLGAPLVQVGFLEAGAVLPDDLLQSAEAPREGLQVVQEAAPESGVKYPEQWHQPGVRMLSQP